MNNYETPDIVEVGKAQEIIQGTKMTGPQEPVWPFRPAFSTDGEIG
jgi:hypothetical protein